MSTITRTTHQAVPTTVNGTEVGDALEIALGLHGATFVRPDHGEIALVPKGMDLQSLKSLHDEWRTSPERRRGEAKLLDAASFIAHTNRFKDDDTAIFCSPSEENPRFLSILDYHRAGPPNTGEAARWGCHRGSFAPALHDVWKAWKAVDGKAMEQGAFATLIEDRILDIAMPPEQEDGASAALVTALGGRVGTQSDLLANARRMRVTEQAEATNAQVLETGDTEIIYRSELRDGHGQPLRIASCFSVMAPVFEGGPAYRLWLRIRIRRAEHKVMWTVHRWRPDLILRHAIDEMMHEIEEETGCPVLRGMPENG